MGETYSMVEALFRMRFVIPQLWIGLDALGASFTFNWDGFVVQVMSTTFEK